MTDLGPLRLSYTQTWMKTRPIVEGGPMPKGFYAIRLNFCRLDMIEQTVTIELDLGATAAEVAEQLATVAAALKLAAP